MPVKDITRPMWLRCEDRVVYLVYMVEAGDTLSDIAQRFTGDASHWHWMAKLNKLEKPEHIEPGQILKIRTVPAGEFDAMLYAAAKNVTNNYTVTRIEEFIRDAFFGEMPVEYVGGALVVGRTKLPGH